MLEKTISTDSTLGLQKAAVKLTLPVIELTSYRADSGINTAIKQDLLYVIGQMIDKQLE
tara:strand:+ start:195 stop:371 length:177 start_codon:yes stop_codon:yes gene_type:complete